MKNLFIVLFTSLFIISCHQDKSENQMLIDLGTTDPTLESSTPHASPLISNTPVSPTKHEIKKKVIKDGEINIEVSDLEKSKSKVDSIVIKNNGYYEREELRNQTWQNIYRLKIRVPSQQFETFIQQIESGTGTITHKNIKTRDVTDQFIDIETRLKNKKNYLKRYNDLLKKAKTVKEILEIEEKIRALEEEIESQTGRLNYLSDLVSYSTLEVTLDQPINEKYNTQKRGIFWKRISYAFSSGWVGFIDAIIFLFEQWPFIILLGIIIYGWRKFKKKK